MSFSKELVPYYPFSPRREVSFPFSKEYAYQFPREFKAKGRTALYIFASIKSDHNGAFYNKEQRSLKERNISYVSQHARQFDQAKVILLRDSEGIRELEQVLSDLVTHKVQLDYLSIAGHGSKQSIILSEQEKERLYVPQRKNLSRRIGSHLRSIMKEGSTVRFQSCKGGVNLTRAFSRFVRKGVQFEGSDATSCGTRLLEESLRPIAAACSKIGELNYVTYEGGRLKQKLHVAFHGKITPLIENYQPFEDDLL